MAANITPLGLFSQVLAPGEAFELETLAADVQLTSISFGAEVKGEGRSSIKMTYFDRSTSNFGMGFGDSDDEESSSDEEEYSEAAETDDDDDSGAVDEAALKKAIEEQSKKRQELAAAAAAAGVSPRKLAKGDASMDKSAAEDEENSEGESDEDDMDMFDMSQDELKEVFIGNLLPGRIEQANINVFLAQGDTYEFQVTGENPVYITGHYCETPRSQVNNGPDYDSDYGSEYDSDDLSESEDGIYDPETGMPYADIDEDTDGERFEEIEAPVPAKKSKADKKSKTVPASAVEDLSMDVDSSAAAPSTSTVADVNTEGLSKNQKKKLKKQQAQAAAAGAKPEVAAVESKKSETVSTNAEGKKTATSSAEAAVTADDTKAKAKKASKKTTLPSGLVLEDVKSGAGGAAKKGQKVSMRYIGKLQNGNIFDSNTKGKPFEFKLGAGQVIKGWDEGIVGMQPGGERRLTIPAKLAYGKSGTQGIPGNATLTFEVKLLSIK